VTPEKLKLLQKDLTIWYLTQNPSLLLRCFQLLEQKDAPPINVKDSYFFKIFHFDGIQILKAELNGEDKRIIVRHGFSPEFARAVRLDPRVISTANYYAGEISAEILENMGERVNEACDTAVGYQAFLGRRELPLAWRERKKYPSFTVQQQEETEAGNNFFPFYSEYCNHFVIVLQKLQYPVESIEPNIVGADEDRLVNLQINFCSGVFAENFRMVARAALKQPDLPLGHGDAVVISLDDFLILLEQDLYSEYVLNGEKIRLAANVNETRTKMLTLRATALSQCARSQQTTGDSCSSLNLDASYNTIVIDFEKPGQFEHLVNVIIAAAFDKPGDPFAANHLAQEEVEKVLLAYLTQNPSILVDFLNKVEGRNFVLPAERANSVWCDQDLFLDAMNAVKEKLQQEYNQGAIVIRKPDEANPGVISSATLSGIKNKYALSVAQRESIRKGGFSTPVKEISFKKTRHDGEYLLKVLHFFQIPAERFVVAPDFFKPDQLVFKIQFGSVIFAEQFRRQITDYGCNGCGRGTEVIVSLAGAEVIFEKLRDYFLQDNELVDIKPRFSSCKQAIQSEVEQYTKARQAMSLEERAIQDYDALIEGAKSLFESYNVTHISVEPDSDPKKSQYTVVLLHFDDPAKRKELADYLRKKKLAKAEGSDTDPIALSYSDSFAGKIISVGGANNAFGHFHSKGSSLLTKLVQAYRVAKKQSVNPDYLRSPSGSPLRETVSRSAASSPLGSGGQMYGTPSLSPTLSSSTGQSRSPTPSKTSTND
jgi:hypothetical protein